LACQLPVELQIEGWKLLHSICAGPQTPEQTPATHVRFAAHALPLGFHDVPCALQTCGCWPLQSIAPGTQNTHTPLAQVGADPLQAMPFGCQLPIALHVSGCVPLHCVWPGPQEPLHSPATQVWLAAHAELPFCHVPTTLHDCGC